MITGSRLAADGEELAIAPQVPCTRFNLFAADLPLHLVVVVHDFERAKTLVTDPQRLRRKRRLA
jgi:hypothetical protein